MVKFSHGIKAILIRRGSLDLEIEIHCSEGATGQISRGCVEPKLASASCSGKFDFSVQVGIKIWLPS